jgi:hypothetical protein
MVRGAGSITITIGIVTGAGISTATMTGVMTAGTIAGIIAGIIAGDNPDVIVGPGLWARPSGVCPTQTIDYSSSVTQPSLALFTSRIYFASVPRVTL